MMTVSDMLAYSQANSLKLLSEYPADFWKDYIANSTRYDKLFTRLYKSFAYFLQDYGDTIEGVTNTFIEDVYNHLMLNDKKYSELYRVQVVDDDKYHIIDNYDIVETMDRKTGNDGTINIGTRSDNNKTDYTQGQQSNTTTTGIEGFNSTDFSNSERSQDSLGQRQDNTTQTFTSGEQTNTNKENGTEEYTLTRKGNIGVQTGADILKRHYDFWRPYEFYSFIFGEIAKELLIV